MPALGISESAANQWLGLEEHAPIHSVSNVCDRFSLILADFCEFARVFDEFCDYR